MMRVTPEVLRQVKGIELRPDDRVVGMVVIKR